MKAADIGKAAVLANGWWPAHRWLILRRSSQLGILALFLLGPLAGLWIVKGNLSSSLTLDVLPLTDPLLVLQSLAAGHCPYSTALIGAAIMLAFYALVGGRVFCSWICPVNLVTDVPLPAVRTIGVTAKSAASVALVRILFPAAEILAEGAPADARLLIGDEALTSALEDATPHHDLGVLWRERTGLPMVFAVWAARRDVADERLVALDRALADAVADASEHAALVAQAAAERYGYPAGYLARYFERLRYAFGEREREGLRRYFELAAEAGIIEAAPPLVFAGDRQGARG